MSVGQTYVVIGAGQAGGRAVEAMRKSGFQGRVVLIGDEGHPPYERPPLSKDFLLGKVDAASTYLFKGADDLAAQDVELRLDDPVIAVSADAQLVRLGSGNEIAFDRLMFATGGRVRELRVPGADLDGVFYLRNLADAVGLSAALQSAERIVVIGGGFLGLEVAAVARQLRKQVTVLEIEKCVLGRALAPELATIVTDLHRDRGTDFRLETAVAAIEGDGGRVRAVVCTDGVSLAADLVVASIGIVPNDMLAREAGIEVENGILVNEYGETSRANFYAAGDVANHMNHAVGRRMRLESWQNAQNQAMAVAKVMCGERQPYAAIPWFWSDQFDVNVQLLGTPTEWDEICFRGEPASLKFSAFYLKDDKVVAAAAFNRSNDMRVARQLIASGKSIDPAVLCDTALDIRKISQLL
ncbi:FAD-dependent oxidoreductase [Bradyrhizobium sp. dw_78]|uniref:NAD(P)/FAD-dependent oxidoreductase n=1 Tax=Bradyrhizobium sp. dw_78 TaxID=2719793 RepID=UPI001BD472A9